MAHAFFGWKNISMACIYSDDSHFSYPSKTRVCLTVFHKSFMIKPRKSHSNDVALLRLARKVHFNNFIQPICLPQPELRFPTAQDVDDFKCFVTGRFLLPAFNWRGDVYRFLFIGWGYLNENATEHATILQEVQVPLQEMLIGQTGMLPIAVIYSLLLASNPVNCADIWLI